MCGGGGEAENEHIVIVIVNVKHRNMILVRSEVVGRTPHHELADAFHFLSEVDKNTFQKAKYVGSSCL